MRIVLRPRAQVEQAWREWEQETHFRREAQPTVVMATESAELLDRRELVFRGRSYVVPPVPYPLAARLLAVQEAMRVLAGRKGAQPAEIIETFARGVALLRDGLRPKGVVRRLLWPLTPNPFRRATPREVGELLGFFSVFLMLDASASSPSARALGTFRAPSPGSSRRSRPGSARTATRGPGAIS